VKKDRRERKGRENALFTYRERKGKREIER
jgi:hypothetical protein